MSLFYTRAATLCLLILVTFLLWLRQASAAPVSVRFVEGVTHGFLVLRTVNGELIASGDLLQVQRDGQVQSRMVFRFKDGSAYDETVVFHSGASLYHAKLRPSRGLKGRSSRRRIETTNPRWPDSPKH